jgi:hypothetical protein
VQEVAVAKDVVYLCGNQVMFGEFWYLSFLASSAQVSDHCLSRSLIGPALQLPTEYIRVLDAIGQIFHFYTSLMIGTRENFQEGKAQYLVDLLLRACNGGLRASGPRDHVFALFGVAADVQKLGIRVDYSRTVVQVFTRTPLSASLKVI